MICAATYPHSSILTTDARSDGLGGAVLESCVALKMVPVQLTDHSLKAVNARFNGRQSLRLPDFRASTNCCRAASQERTPARDGNSIGRRLSRRPINTKCCSENEHDDFLFRPAGYSHQSWRAYVGDEPTHSDWRMLAASGRWERARQRPQSGRLHDGYNGAVSSFNQRQ
jgi:hypothetical protein